MTTLRLLFIVALGLVGSVVAFGADKIPALLEVSSLLPAAEQASFLEQRAKIQAHWKDFKEASDRFNKKTAELQSDQEFMRLTKQRADYIQSVNQFNAVIIARMAALDSGDTKVVDARDVPSGLWQGMDGAIATVYADAPAGVSDRVRKGFQAVMDRDWKVAKAWFEDALKRDPDNAGLKRLVALADLSTLPAKPLLVPDARTEPAGLGGNSTPRAGVGPANQVKPSWLVPGTELQMPDPNDLFFLFPGLKALPENEMMDVLFGLDAPSTGPKPVVPNTAVDESPPLPAKAELKPNWGAFFDALFKNPPKSKYRPVSAVRG